MTPNIEATPELLEPLVKRRGRLLKVLGAGFGIAIIIGNTIGAGILRTPGDVAALLPHIPLFMGVWIAGGIFALLGAVSIAELGTMLPRSGGQYVFARYALGECAGFVVGWSDWISSCGSVAAISIVIGEYSGELVPFLASRGMHLALGATTLFALLQWRGIIWGSNIQNITSLIKALAFIALIAACFVIGGGGKTASLAVAPLSGMPLLGAFVLSLQAVIYTYDGWNGPVYFSEEVRNPGRDIPRSMIGGVLSVIAIYLLFNLALIHVLPLSEIAGAKLAAGVAAGVIFGAHGDTVIRSLTILSMLSAVNANLLMGTRVIFSMSRDGLGASRAANVNAGGTPSLALLLSAGIAMLFIVSGTFEKVLSVLAFFFVANYTVSFVSLFVLRRREPLRERPYRAWGYPWTTGIALVGSCLFLLGAVVSDTRNSVYALLLLAASYPAFRLLRWTNSSGLPA